MTVSPYGNFGKRLCRSCPSCTITFSHLRSLNLHSISCKDFIRAADSSCVNTGVLASCRPFPSYVLLGGVPTSSVSRSQGTTTRPGPFRYLPIDTRQLCEMLPLAPTYQITLSVSLTRHAQALSKPTATCINSPGAR